MPCPCRYRAMPCFIHTYHDMPMPRPCRAPTMLFWKRLLKATAQHSRGAAWARHGMCELTSAVGRQPVGDLSRFGSFRLPRGVPRRLSSESHTEMQLASVKPRNVFHGRGETDYFVARTWVLYNLQHRDNDNNLVDNIWRPYIVTSSMYAMWLI
jgi:hypothetical protein